MKRALLLLAACTAHQTPKNVRPPDAGVTISVYAKGESGYSVIDDRRWVDIKGRSILLANIDPGADLASLQIEPTTNKLHVGSCTRDRLPDLVFVPSNMNFEQMNSAFKRGLPYAVRAKPEPIAQTKTNARYAPVVKCEVTADPGRYLVRILYVSKTLRYRAQHDIELRDPRRASIVSRFAIETPPWRTRADVILFDGVPGSENTPTEVTRGSIELDGTTAILAIPEKTATAELRRIYDGAVLASDDKRDPMWGHDSVPSVWLWLELANTHLAPGPVHVHVDVPDEGIRDAEIAAEKRQQDEDDAKSPLRLPLWIDPDLRGMRSRIVEVNDGGALAERIVFGIANMGEVPRDVFTDEHLRPAKRRRIDRAWPKKLSPTTTGETLRAKLSVAPGRVARAGYTLSYEF